MVQYKNKQNINIENSGRAGMGGMVCSWQFVKNTGCSLPL
jgi:hypothetical protein